MPQMGMSRCRTTLTLERQVELASADAGFGRFSGGSPRTPEATGQPSGAGVMPQMSFAYSRIVRSDEKNPVRATLSRAERHHRFGST